MKDMNIKIIDLELARLIRRVTSASRKIGHLDRSAYLILNRILSEGPAGVKVLAEEAHLDISTLSRQTASLEQKGYVERIPDPVDRRAYTLQITELGKKEFYEHQKLRFAALDENLEAWADDEIEVFAKLLTKYNHPFTKKES
ncbi:MarR family transcriptional regulator [Neobacillus piezotolerans]|uniref:MarR family transcriptional regulator n=1 Tax=Neobacillus piezotolerans TaxID=2259171 RepID=A0A3D8GMD6_9BACI|nr:MarR family transcriptional regulator [Neobacillus piezotolerans]RDU35630.1 MarR family transcriptional regulator [Neobacillus piezotolerans]